MIKVPVSMKCRESFLLALMITVFIAFEASSISLPGLYCEETLNAVKVLGLVEGLKNSIDLGRLFAQGIPIREGPYHYAFMSYLLAPFFYFAGISVFSLRLMPVLSAAAGLAVFYYFLKIFFNKTAAFLSVLLLIANPTFIMEVKLGNQTSPMLSVFAFASLLSLFLWYRDRKARYFATAVFFLGLGFVTRIWFLWFLFSLLLLGAVFRGKLQRQLRLSARDKLRLAALGIISFSIGGWLFVYASFTGGFPLLRFAVSHFRSPLFQSDYNNFNYFLNLAANIGTFNKYLSDSLSFTRQFNVPAGDYSYAVLFWFSFLWLLAASFRQKQIIYRRSRKVFIALLFLFMLLQTPVVFSWPPTVHLLIFYPLVQIIIVLAVVEMFCCLRSGSIPGKIIRFVAAAVLAAVFLAQIQGVALYFSLLKKNGGAGVFSDAVYRLNDFIMEQGYFPVIMCSWGMQNILDIVSGAAIITRGDKDVFHLSPETFESRVHETMRDTRKPVFVFLAPRFARASEQQFLPRLREAAESMGRRAVEVKRFYQRNGELVYLAYSVE